MKRHTLIPPLVKEEDGIWRSRCSECGHLAEGPTKHLAQMDHNIHRRVEEKIARLMDDPIVATDTSSAGARP